MKGKIKLYTENCIDTLKKLENNSVEHCITDPPYNISGNEHRKEIGWYKSNKLWSKDKKFQKISEEWDKFSQDEYFDFTIQWLQEVKRVVKDNGNIVIFGTYHNIYKIGFIADLLELKIINSIVWYKRNAFPNITQRMLCESTEQAIWCCNNTPKKATNWTFNYDALKDLTENKKQMRNMWDIPMTKQSERSEGKHPSQKPLEVAKRLILGLSDVGDTIIDPFAGSGTFLVASKMHGRNAIGIEKIKEYSDLCKRRLDKVL